jgi:hypothetical protein
MAKMILAVLAALLFGVVMAGGADAASRGKRFYDGLKSPAELAALVEANLAKDSSGAAMLDPARCSAPHWSCAAPADYLKIIREFDPDATVNGEPLTRVDQLPAFFRKLRVENAPSGEYWMACMRKATPSSDWEPLDNCVARVFHPGEKAWTDPDTGRVVLAQDCTNPVGKPRQKIGCADDVIYAEAGDTILLNQRGPTDLSHHVCTGLLRAGETEWESPYVERCAHPYCSLKVSDRYSSYPAWAEGSFVAEQSGYFIVRHPAFVAEKDSGYEFFYCRKHEGRQACLRKIAWQDYHPASHSPRQLGGDAMAAIIFPDQESLDQSSNAKDRNSLPSKGFWDFHLSDCPPGPL